jgi:2'-5' RNA ligase
LLYNGGVRKFSIICLFDKESTKEIRHIMTDLSQMTGSKTAMTFPPHLSLRNDFIIQEDNLKHLNAALDQLTITMKKIQLETHNYGFYPWKILFIKVKPSELLQKLHEEIMELVQTYRTDWVDEKLADSDFFSGKQKDYIHRYGYQFAFEYFSPHITVVSKDITQELFEQTKNDLLQQPFSKKLIIESIALVDREQGNSIYKQFPLH